MGRGRPQAPKKERVCYLARTGRVGRGDLRARAPELAPLAEASIAVFGLGCIGAPSALDLARATVGDLRLIEYDHVDPATMVRWPLGLRAAGVQKLDVMVDLLQRDYPFTSVTGYSLKVGAPQFGPEPSNASMMNDALDGVALVYDATAEYGVQHYLSEVARGKRLPYVGVSSTQGGWGGVVMRIRPGITRGCWACVQLGINDGTIEAPPFDAANGAVQPAGCAEPTYTGANFDLGHVALMGVRLAIATLCSAAGAAASPRSTSAYPDFDWDVGVLALRDTDGRSIAPTWRTYPLPPHPNCQTCAARTRSD